MRLLRTFGVFVGALIILGLFLSLMHNTSAQGSSTLSRMNEIPVGVIVGKGAFYRQVLGTVGDEGRGLIRVDWDNNGKDEIVIVFNSPAFGATHIAKMEPKLGCEELFFPVMDYTCSPTAADMNGDGLPEFCTGASWGTEAVVYSHLGKKLFTYEPYKLGTNETILADLKGDGRALVIAGFNGTGGLRAADSTGKTVFRDKRGLGNVWNVDAADLNGDGKLEVINSGGDLTVWSSDLKYLRTLDTPNYAAGFAAVDHDGDGKSELLLSSGLMMDGEGNEIFPGDKSEDMPFPSYAVTADISSSPGLETAWAQDSFNNFKILAQKGKVLYQEGLKKNVTGLICTSGLQGWEPGFLLQLEDGTLIHFGRKVK
jgi:hypothetical protein